MRTTLQIIIAVKESQPVTEEELRLALLAMASIEHFASDELRALAEAVESDKPSAVLRAGFARGTLERMFQAKKSPPNVWLGPRNTPGTPEYTDALRVAKAIYHKATGEKL